MSFSSPKLGLARRSSQKRCELLLAKAGLGPKGKRTGVIEVKLINFPKAWVWLKATKNAGRLCTRSYYTNYPRLSGLGLNL